MPGWRENLYLESYISEIFVIINFQNPCYGSVCVMMERAKRIYIWTTEINRWFSSFVWHCFLKEIMNIFSVFLPSKREHSWESCRNAHLGLVLPQYFLFSSETEIWKRTDSSWFRLACSKNNSKLKTILKTYLLFCLISAFSFLPKRKNEHGIFQ